MSSFAEYTSETQKARIIVVDDEPAVLDCLRQMLLHCGNDVFPFIPAGFPASRYRLRG
jgi:CheY-like chemotaxis protein